MTPKKRKKKDEGQKVHELQVRERTQRTDHQYMKVHVCACARINRTSKPLFERYLGGSDPYAVCYRFFFEQITLDECVSINITEKSTWI